MRIPIPPAPELTPVGALWAVVVAVVAFFVMAVGLIYWPPLAISVPVLFLLAEVWLIGGEMWNDWRDSRERL